MSILGFTTEFEKKMIAEVEAALASEKNKPKPLHSIFSKEEKEILLYALEAARDVLLRIIDESSFARTQVPKLNSMRNKITNQF